MISKYGFYRTELRVLQATVKDNEEFLNRLANLIGSLNDKIEESNMRVSNAEHEVRLWENGEKS